MYFVFSQEWLDFIECCLVWLCHTKRRHEQALVIRVDKIEDSSRVKSKETINIGFLLNNIYALFFFLLKDTLITPQGSCELLLGIGPLKEYLIWMMGRMILTQMSMKLMLPSWTSC